ncbi:hypothetical protein PQ478_12525 [Alkalihalophilus pseudofirmus]|uniref:ATP-grasp domain-containing protein n=1 Tax=Alkalihalophilus pseudofirmus TaxID=79885 RepID=UPI00259BABE6|nr:hypothetical protein [Alkalihalophilus pseudofirmus]WEG15364.1 hypothetical protein PQ478_12525 [Alkalihalophilus pseudofirmus]
MIYAYEDNRNWGELLFHAGKTKGVNVNIFKYSHEIPNNSNNTVFVHMNHHPKFREQNKKMMKQLSKKDVKLIPTLLEAQLYDDKVAQYQLLYEHMPKSYYLQSEAKAKEIIEKIDYPFISKAKEGAGSSNIRLINNKQEAINEIKLAFSTGIPLHFDQNQKNYLFWQHFCKDNKGDWRVHVIANKYVCVLRRYNKNNVPFASGSNNVETVNALDPFTTELIETAFSIAKKYNFNLCAMDFVTENGKPILLETSVGWPIKHFQNRTFFHKENNVWTPSKYVSDNFFELIIDSIMNNDFT